VPSVSPATAPYTFEHDRLSRTPFGIARVEPHAVLQHTVSTQKPLAHCVADEHFSPIASDTGCATVAVGSGFVGVVWLHPDKPKSPDTNEEMRIARRFMVSPDGLFQRRYALRRGAVNRFRGSMTDSG